ncbi:hypothetical protein HDU83_008577 [Entophlyctis luteolus]|nr:hypothetical protein HDU83_008577 [Entophlyctis luteolus]
MPVFGLCHERPYEELDLLHKCQKGDYHLNLNPKCLIALSCCDGFFFEPLLNVREEGELPCHQRQSLSIKDIAGYKDRPESIWSIVLWENPKPDDLVKPVKGVMLKRLFEKGSTAEELNRKLSNIRKNPALGAEFRLYVHKTEDEI